MASLKDQLRSDLTAAMKSRDSARVATLRMALTGVANEEVSGKAARELTDDDVLRVINREVRKRKEAAEAFDGAGRAEQAAAELHEAEMLEEYLPAQLTNEELEVLVAQAIDEVTQQLGGAPGAKQLGQVMKSANAKVAGRAEGGRVAAAVKARLQG